MQRADERWTIVVHGGARSIGEGDRPTFDAGCREAASAGARLLEAGGSAIDAVEIAVRILENLPIFNAGHGSVTNTDGIVEMDAAIMEGDTLHLGAVAAIKDVQNPIEVARALLHDDTTLLVADGAERFARTTGALPALPPPLRQPEAGGDTVGCVARDIRGLLVAGGSTGGINGKRPGRVGDTPLPGCGLYADNQMGAAALSGHGESISRGMLAARALHLLDRSPPMRAADQTIRLLDRTGGEAGIILVHPDGRIGIAHNSSHFALGVAASFIEGTHAGTHRNELLEWTA